MKANHKKRAQAREMYLAGMSPLQIAGALQLSKATIQRWKNDDGWDGMADQANTSPSELARLVRKSMATIVLAAEDENRTLTVKETDQLSKLTAVLRKIAPFDVTITTTVDVTKRFVSHLKAAADKQPGRLTFEQINEAAIDFLSGEYKTLDAIKRV